jgi:hypothetical protein
MRFLPKNENELSNVIDAGVYSFEITEASDEVSKAGNEMIKLKVLIYESEVVATCIFDYLMEKVAYKLRHCCDACGLLDKYDTGELTSMQFIGKTGKCNVAIQKDETGKYPDKNTIKDYVKRELSQAVDEAKRVNPVAGEGPVNSKDDLPF